MIFVDFANKEGERGNNIYYKFYLTSVKVAHFNLLTSKLKQCEFSILKRSICKVFDFEICEQHTKVKHEAFLNNLTETLCAAEMFS